jgi:DNA polymerase-3 subunit beta
MKFKIVDKDLQAITKSVVPALIQKGAMSSYAWIKITAAEDTVTFEVITQETTLKNSVKAEVTEGGCLGVDGKLLSDVVPALEGVVSFATINETKLQLKVNKRQITLPVISPDSFLLSPIDISSTIFVEAKNFFQCFNKVSHCIIGDEEGRIFYKNFAIREGKMMATDGKRLAIQPFECNIDHEIVLPADVITKFKKVFSDEELQIGLHMSMLFFKQGSKCGAIRLLDGNYPSIEKVIPKSSYDEAKINKAELLNSLKVAKTVTREDLNVVKLSFNRDNLNIETDTLTGRFEDTVTCDFYKDHVANHNLDFLIASLEKVSGDTVVVQLRPSDMPMVILDGGYIQLLMPIRK